MRTWAPTSTYSMTSRPISQILSVQIYSKVTAGTMEKSFLNRTYLREMRLNFISPLIAFMDFIDRKSAVYCTRGVVNLRETISI